MSSFKPCFFTLLCAVMLAPACAKTPQPAVESPVTPVASAAACDGAVFQEKCVHKGDTVTFGNYPQATETPEPIEWIVLDIDASKGQILFLSKYVLDAKPYHTEKTAITWENSTLRTWLNDTFKTTAFTSSEQQQIALTHLENPDNPTYGTNGGNATSDYVFLLSLADALSQTDDETGSGKYFIRNADRHTLATMYAINNGVEADKNVVGFEYEQSNNVTYKEIQISQFSASWWLRSPGYDTSKAAGVDYFGIVDPYGPYVNDAWGVRPALWVKY